MQHVPCAISIYDNEENTIDYLSDCALNIAARAHRYRVAHRMSRLSTQTGSVTTDTGEDTAVQKRGARHVHEHCALGAMPSQAQEPSHAALRATLVREAAAQIRGAQIRGAQAPRGPRTSMNASNPSRELTPPSPRRRWMCTRKANTCCHRHRRTCFGIPPTGGEGREGTRRDSPSPSARPGK